MTYKQYFKKHTSLTGPYVLAGLFLANLFGLVTGNVRLLQASADKEMLTSPIAPSFPFLTFFTGFILLIYWSNSRLFYLREQDKTILLLRKYDALPVDRKDFYRLRISVLIRAWLVYLACSVVMYYAAILVYTHRNVLWQAPFMDILAITFFSAIFLGGTLLIDYVQEVRSRP